VIRPRVPSLFEPTPVDFSDEQQSSTSTPISELSPVQEIVPRESVPSAIDLTEEHSPKPGKSRREGVGTEALLQPKHLIVPVDSSRAKENQSDSTTEVQFSETLASPPPRRKHFTPVEKRSSTPAQIIRVTIGRVEVRAVHSPAPTPKSAKNRAPKLSLEDYLRKRERGLR
jgi:hypothetical protein